MPTLSSEVSRRITNVAQENNGIVSLKKNMLPDNSKLASEVMIELVKDALGQALEQLYAENNGKKPIVLVTDSCFTNTLLKNTLRDILTPEKFEKYVSLVDIDYESDGNTITSEALHNDSLIIL